MDPPLVEAKSYRACFKRAFVGLFVTARCQAAGAGAGGEHWGGRAAFPLCQDRPSLLLGGGMLRHNSLGQEMKGDLAAGAGFFSIDFWVFFLILPVDETINPLPAAIAPAPLAELPTLCNPAVTNEGEQPLPASALPAQQLQISIHLALPLVLPHSTPAPPGIPHEPSPSTPSPGPTAPAMALSQP